MPMDVSLPCKRGRLRMRNVTRSRDADAGSLVSKFLERPFLVVATCVVLISGACARKDGGASQTQGLAVKGAEYVGGRAWVCWTEAGFEKEKAEIKALVEENFNERTNLQFLGFGPCDAQEKKDVRVKIAELKTAYGRSQIGVSSTIPVNEPGDPASPNMFLDKDMFADPPVYLRSRTLRLNTTLHEFGHAAGLLHEHTRHDVEKGCRKELESRGYKGIAEEDFVRKVFEKNASQRVIRTGEFDALSVMNYCYIQESYDKDSLISLSKGDLGALAALYGERKDPVVVKPSPTIPPTPSTEVTPPLPTEDDLRFGSDGVTRVSAGVCSKEYPPLSKLEVAQLACARYALYARECYVACGVEPPSSVWSPPSSQTPGEPQLQPGPQTQPEPQTQPVPQTQPIPWTPPCQPYPNCGLD